MEEEKYGLYTLIVKQLLKDGYSRVAEHLCDVAMLPMPRQTHFVDEEPDLEAIVRHHRLTYVPSKHKNRESSVLQDLVIGGTLDLETGSGASVTRERTPNPVPRFTLRHKGPVTSGGFNWDGSTFACGSADGEIKVVDAPRAFRADQEGDGGDTQHLGGLGVVQKSFLDHTDAVTTLVFHPCARVLLSGSSDKTIRMFAYTSMSTRAFEMVAESHAVRSIAFHPTGDYFLAACRHPLLRLYVTDQPRAAPLVARVGSVQHHTQPVNHVSWSLDGSLYTSASKDGSIKIWDAVSSKVTRTISGAHDGHSVNSAVLSRNGAYILSTGRDSFIRIYDVRTGGMLRRFKGTQCHKGKLRASFWGPSDEYILCGSEADASVIAWDVASETLLSQWTAHSQFVPTCISHPLSGIGGSMPLAFASCGSDNCVKFWSE